MTIARGSSVNNLALYPQAQPSLTIIKTRKQHVSYLTGNIRSLLTIEDVLEFKYQTKDDIINTYINRPEARSHLKCQNLLTAYITTKNSFLVTV